MPGRRTRRPTLTGLGWALVAAVGVLLALALLGPRQLAGAAWAALAIMLLAWVVSWPSLQAAREARRRGRGFRAVRERDDPGSDHPGPAADR